MFVNNEILEKYKKIRKDWEDIKPITKTIENKKKYKRKEIKELWKELLM